MVVRNLVIKLLMLMGGEWEWEGWKGGEWEGGVEVVVRKNMAKPATIFYLHSDKNYFQEILLQH